MRVYTGRCGVTVAVQLLVEDLCEESGSLAVVVYYICKDPLPSQSAFAGTGIFDSKVD